MHKYIGSDITSMVTLPVLIFEPMTMLQKMAEVCTILFRECFCRFCASYIVLLDECAMCVTDNGVLIFVGSGRRMRGSLYAVGVCL